MKIKVIGGLLTIILSFLLFFVGMDTKVADDPVAAFQVYLDGEKVGLIDSKDELLALIDEEQSEIKNVYNVDKVYPPDGLNVQKIYTYNDTVEDARDIYNKIKDVDPFTIEGYVVTITYTEKKVINDGEILEPGAPLKIYLMDKDIINEALYNTAAAFIGAENLSDFEKETQEEITDTGSIITSLYFEEKITIKKDYISTEDYIFTDAETLSQYLLFGTLDHQKEYTTKEGENLEMIAEDNHLNMEELLIANPQYMSANVLLSPGEKINVSLISPLVSVVYYKTVVSDIKIAYKTEYVDDKTKFNDYKEVTQKGEDGISRVTQNIKYINGEIQNLNTLKVDKIKQEVNEVITRGTKVLGGGSYVHETGQGNDDWSWPTASPYTITSGFKWRWGRQHQGIDIAVIGRNNGYGSPAYAVQAGTVFNVNYNRDKSEGLSVYIDHGNGYYTVYMHLSKILVSVGQKVDREQRVGLIGNTGGVTGTHLHLGVFKGRPYQGGVAVDPCNSIFSCGLPY